MTKKYKLKEKPKTNILETISQAKLQIKYVPINSLLAAEYNPREATEDQVLQLKANMIKFGFVDPAIVNSSPKRKNVIIGGHFRLRVAKELGYKEVPVIFIRIDDIKKEKELNIRLNKNTGRFSTDILANNFEMAELMEWGFTAKELDLPAFKNLSGSGSTGKTEISGSADIKSHELKFKDGAEYDEFLQFLHQLKKMYDLEDEQQALLRFFRERLELTVDKNA